MNYKIGDRVICIKDVGFTLYESTYGGTSMPTLGKIFTIVKIRKVSNTLYYCSGYKPHNLVFYEDEITLATPLMEELV